MNHSVGIDGVRFSLVYSNYDLEQQRYTGNELTADAVTRVELVLTGARAFDRFAALEAKQSEIRERLNEVPLVWYAEAEKERKVFTQRIWPRDDSYSQAALFDWFLSTVERLRGVLLDYV